MPETPTPFTVYVVREMSRAETVEAADLAVQMHRSEGEGDLFLVVEGGPHWLPVARLVGDHSAVLAPERDAAEGARYLQFFIPAERDAAVSYLEAWPSHPEGWRLEFKTRTDTSAVWGPPDVVNDHMPLSAVRDYARVSGYTLEEAVR